MKYNCAPVTVSCIYRLCRHPINEGGILNRWNLVTTSGPLPHESHVQEDDHKLGHLVVKDTWFVVSHVG